MGQTISGFPRTIQSAIIPGGPVGEFFVSGGINAGDTLISARHVSADLVTNADITANVTIVAGKANTINVAVTVTTGNFIIVTWAEPE